MSERTGEDRSELPELPEEFRAILEAVEHIGTSPRMYEHQKVLVDAVLLWKMTERFRRVLMYANMNARRFAEEQAALWGVSDPKEAWALDKMYERDSEIAELRAVLDQVKVWTHNLRLTVESLHRVLGVDPQ